MSIEAMKQADHSEDALEMVEQTQPAATGKQSFTVGPWHVAEQAKIKHQEGTLIAQAEYWPDARLIAAAPDLLEALQGLLRGIDDGADDASAALLVAKARDAIAKAVQP